MKKQEITEIQELQLEYIINELSRIADCILNADYCKGCWKFNFCSQVPFSKRIFRPCRALVNIEEDINRVLNDYEMSSKDLYEDLLDLLYKKEAEIELLKERVSILESRKE